MLEKTAVQGTRGGVVAQHRGAAEAGAEILRAGGNAVDAALATAFSLGVLEPWMSGIGGGGYLLIGRHGEVPTLVDFSLRAPVGIRPTDYPIVEGKSSDFFPWPSVEGERNTRGPLAVCAPTAVAGLELAWRRFGTLPWRTLLEPAIGFAREGLSIDWYTQLILSSLAKDLRHEPAARARFLDEGGASITTGWTALSRPTIDMGTLSDTLDVIAEEGGEAIVRGDIGHALVQDVAERGGVLEMRDFEAAAPQLVKPAHVSYRSHRVWTASGLSGGVAIADALHVLGAREIHSNVRGAFYGEIVDAIVPSLRARQGILGDSSAPGDDGSCTTHFCVADARGLVVSATLTLVSMFGSKVLSPRTGIMLNNGMSWFDPVPGRANSIGPGKRCLNNMAPTLVHVPDGGLIAVGAAGGRKIIPAVVQILTFMIDGGLSLQAALRQPRLDVHHDRTIIADERIGEETRHVLRNHGQVYFVENTIFPYRFGITEALRLSRGRLEAMPDPTAPWSGAVCT